MKTTSYSIFSYRDHILAYPYGYIGSTKPITQKMDVYDSDIKKIVSKKIAYVEGLYTIFDEAIINAMEHSKRDKTMTKLCVNINQEEGSISVYNNGAKCIPVEKHRGCDCYIPESVFTNLNQSCNCFDKNINLGIKKTVIMSSRVEITIGDSQNLKEFSMICTDNMYNKTLPIIEKLDEGSESFVKIKFIPDYKKFGLTCLTDDMLSLFKKRVHDIAAIISAKVYLNGDVIQYKNFGEFASLYINHNGKYVYEKINDKWQIGVVASPDFRTISFMNGFSTFNSGSHTYYASGQIMCKLLKKRGHDTWDKNLAYFVFAQMNDVNFTSS